MCCSATALPIGTIWPPIRTIRKAWNQHLSKPQTPEWAAAITGLAVNEIEDFARIVGTTKKTFFRLGFGFTRQRNGSVNMHAALSIPAVTGAWKYEGGGAFYFNSGIYSMDKREIEGRAFARSIDPPYRSMQESGLR